MASVVEVGMGAVVMSGGGGGGSFCLAGSYRAEDGFRGTNRSALPGGIGVGYHNDVPVVCLGEDANRTLCYKDQPTLHRILSAFDMHDYKDNVGEQPWDEIISSLSVDDVGKLVPGMELHCRWRGTTVEKEDDEGKGPKLSDATFLTADQNLQEGLIGVYYHEEEVKEWIPSSWCNAPVYNGILTGYIDEEVWSCDDDDDDGNDEDSAKKIGGGGCDYIVSDDNRLFHRAFKSLQEKRRKPKEGEGKSLFTYTDYNEVIEEDGYYPYIGVGSGIYAGMDISSYTNIYSMMPFKHDLVLEVDKKLSLYKLYKDDPDASKVFPKSYASYKEALVDTEDEHKDRIGDVIFYVKHSGGTRGEDIYIMTWKELSDEYKEVDGSADDHTANYIVQRSVSDLYTIDGDGPIAGRRFDIRYFVLIAGGKAYLHSSMWCKWVYGPKYDPNDTDPKRQISNLAVYGGGDTARLIFPDVLANPDDGSEWNNNENRRRRTITGSSRRGADPHGWRDALADALDDASGVFANLKEFTRLNPTKYALMGGDAMVREDRSVVIVEFNVWCDLNSKYERLEECLAGQGCRRMVILQEGGDDDAGGGGDNYHVTEQTPVTDIVSIEALSGVLRDTASLVMQIEPVQEIAGFREIVSRNK